MKVMLWCHMHQLHLVPDTTGRDPGLLPQGGGIFSVDGVECPEMADDEMDDCSPAWAITPVAPEPKAEADATVDDPDDDVLASGTVDALSHMGDTSVSQSVQALTERLLGGR